VTASRDEATDVPVIDLSLAPGEHQAWDRPKRTVYLWAVVFRPRTRVKFPWKLRIGDRSWIGEGVWFHNQDLVTVGHDVVISQETMLTTGSHAHRRDMALLTRPIVIEPGAWITSRCMVLGGAHVGRSALARPMTVVQGRVPDGAIVSGPDGTVVGSRFGRS
jgi:putative colanic acid biosynthesis acetyltransferase WcaF